MATSFYRALMAIAALLMAIATGLGAWASHGLAALLDASALRAFETAVSYQFVHALGLLGLGIFCTARPGTRMPGLAALVLLGGILLFCGGLYASSLGGPEWVASLAPVGGIGLIVGWILAGVGLWIARPPPVA
jgi:uncharacterized membrane protein YgdD (TMEM256/DUF423 family)